MSTENREANITKADRIQYWEKKWDNQDIRFHKLQPNEDLINFIDKVTIGRDHLTFLVPLCGKSLDVIWLYQQGHTVIGIELCELAITSFFTEQQLQFNKHEVKGGTVYQSLDERIKIYNGDLFGFDVETVGKVDAVWDRGSLVAVYKDERVKYVELMKSFLKNGFRYLLQTIEYDGEITSSANATPRSVSREEVRSLYADFCNIEELNANDKTQEIKRNREDFLTDLIMQYDILLTDKSVYSITGI